MVNKSKIRGTSWESAIVRYLIAEGLAGAERRALCGAADRGDIAGLIDWVISAKNCKAMSLAAWVDEVQLQQANDGARNSAVWHHRRGKASPADGYVTITGVQFTRLLREAGYLPAAPEPGGSAHATCLDVTALNDPPGTRTYVCGPECPPAGAPA